MSRTEYEMRQQLKWANTLKGDIISPEDRDIIFKFVLFFNIFEDWLVQPDNKHQFLEPLCNDLRNEDWFQICQYDHYGSFFVNRYIRSGVDGKKRFDELKLEKKFINIVRDSLEGFNNNELKDDLFFAYMLIAYRFRNNLFHGSKSSLGLDIYIECFEKINCMLYKLLSDMLDHQFKGLKEKYPNGKIHTSNTSS
jgi:hypothetical protein